MSTRGRVTATAGATMLTGLVQQPTSDSSGADDPGALTAEGAQADDGPPPIVQEELHLLDVVLRKLDGGGPRKVRIQVDDASALIELRDALAEAKPEDQGSILEQMHRIEALSKQRGKGDTPPVDRKSPYFGHLRLEENGKRRDVLIGARSFVEPGGGVQIVDWRNAPVSRLFYRYEEGDEYEERLGDRMVEGEVLARRTVAIVDAELRRVAAPAGHVLARHRAPASGAQWRRGRRACRSRATAARWSSSRAARRARRRSPPPPAVRGKLGFDGSGERRPDRHLPAIAALIDPRQFELITQPTSGLIAIQGSAGSGKTTIGLHRIAYLAFADPRRFRPEKMLVIVYQRALATYVSRVLPSLDVEGVPVMTFAGWADAARARGGADAGGGPDRRDAAAGDARQGARRDAADHRRSPGRDRGLVPGAAGGRSSRARPTRTRRGGVLGRTDRAGRRRASPRSPQLAARRRRCDPATRNALENAGRTLRARTRDVLGEWAALLTDREALGDGLRAPRAGLFSPGQLDDIHRWCVERDRLRTAAAQTTTTSETFALDAEDDALLLRIYQLQRGASSGRQGRRSSLTSTCWSTRCRTSRRWSWRCSSTRRPRSVRSRWPATPRRRSRPSTASRLGRAARTSWASRTSGVEPLRVSYRSTREIVDVRRARAGAAAGRRRGRWRRARARPSSRSRSRRPASAPSSCRTRSRSCSATSRTPRWRCWRATPSRRASYYDALVRAEVPSLRRVRRPGLLVRPGHRRHRRAPVQGPRVRRRHPARRQRRVVPRRPTTRAACSTSR